MEKEQKIGNVLDTLINTTLRDIFRINLGVRRHERVLIFNDRISDNEEVTEAEWDRRLKIRSLSLLASEIGKAFCNSVIYFEFPATGTHGAEPPAGLWKLSFGEKAIKALQKEHLLKPILQKRAKDPEIRKAREIIGRHKNAAVNCVIALSNYSTSHTSFRDLLTTVCGCRYASLPLFDITMLEGSMNVDWKELARRTMGIAKVVNLAERIEVRTPNGTRISFSKKGRKVLSDTGILTRKGAFGNLPAGEVYLAPVEGTAQGKLVLEWAPTRQLRSPVTLIIKNGYVVHISGADEYVGYLRKKLAEKKENGNIAELGIGTNNAATRPDNILESEKILGTIHMALGDNSSMGGTIKTPFHQDFVFFRPTVTLVHPDKSRKEILRAGKLLC
ncbi:MAG: peptidase [Nitrospirota bacterium]